MKITNSFFSPLGVLSVCDFPHPVFPAGRLLHAALRGSHRLHGVRRHERCALSGAEAGHHGMGFYMYLLLLLLACSDSNDKRRFKIYAENALEYMATNRLQSGGCGNGLPLICCLCD
ncbi:hypothetical protein AVEN_127447-1 [Araneus ventricosus]|uniref:Uncharacterized protein n=1 Tax=Araneus ventricosus TaxID=182803 RepID=A0A4Y2LG22_ARAVE|nr:hypothetical protein AVEN_127447-1 [Araneus ventricosus]